MKKYIGLAAIIAALSCVIVGLSTDVSASNCAGVGCGNWAHRLSGNGQPPDCKLATKWLVGSKMDYDVSTPTGLPEPAPQYIEVIYHGKVQAGAGPAGMPACPSYIENGNWH